MTKEADVIRVLKPYLMAFPSSHVKEDTLIIYARALSRLDATEIEAAMAKLLETLAYFPAVSQIMEAAKSIRETAQESTLPDGGAAWEEVLKQARYNGLDRPWEFSCPEVKKALERFGKTELMYLEENQTNTARAQFLKIYAEVIQSEKTKRENDAVLDAIPGARSKLAQNKIIQLAEAKAMREAAK